MMMDGAPDDKQTAEVLVAAICDAVAHGDPSSAKLLFHPYLRWTFPSGVEVRGRTKVLAALSGVSSLPHPASVDLRDGQIYRWVAA